MVSYGTTALIIYFCIVFAVNTAGVVAPTSTNITTQSDVYKNETMHEKPSLTMENIVQEWLAPELLGATAIFGIAAYVVSGSLVLMMAAAAIAFMANKLLIPINLISQMGLPHPFNWFVLGFMNILLLVAIFSFIRGKDF